MGPIIPPSLPMIMAATMTGLSVSKMFMAGIVPGILMGGGMALVSYVISKRRKYPKREHMSSVREILKSGREAIWAIIMTLIILFGIIGGGDTGSDCLGTSLRQGAKDVTVLQIMPGPRITATFS